MTTIRGIIPDHISAENIHVYYSVISRLDTTTIHLGTESLGLAILPKDWESGIGHRLNSLLLVQLRTTERGVLAITYLDAEEYGWGKTENEAMTDLMISLVEYMQSLEARREQLGDPGLADLNKLWELLGRDGRNGC